MKTRPRLGLRKKPFQTVLGPIDAKIEHFSNGKDKTGKYTLAVKSEAKEEVQAAGDFSIVPLRETGNLRSGESP